MNANAEDLRSYFVSHEGQKELVLKYDGVTRYTMDFSIMARDFAGLLKENVHTSLIIVYSLYLTDSCTFTLYR